MPPDPRMPFIDAYCTLCEEYGCMMPVDLSPRSRAAILVPQTEQGHRALMAHISNVKNATMKEATNGPK